MPTAIKVLETNVKPRLSRIHVSLFRSIRDVDLELSNLSVLIGANGSGKSNLLEFLNMLRHIVSGRLQYFVARSGGASSILRYGPKVTPELTASLRKYLSTRLRPNLSSG